jgi:hypothetical protein
MICQLESRQDEQVVQQTCARGLRLDRLQIALEVAGVNVVRARTRMSPGVVAAHAVVGDAEDVEVAGAVQVDHLAQGERPVAERRVAMKLAEELFGSR